ncbi:MAG: endonuclease III [Pseudomonadota bacterium]
MAKGVKLGSPVERVPEIIRKLKKAYPDAKVELDFKTPLELLVASILSAQCTDAKVNEITPALFKKYPSAKAYAKASTSELERMIRPTGFYKNKARSIQNCCTQLAMEYGGRVPEDMDDLTKLAGVGRKTANLVRGHAFDKPAIICDTHVLRVSERLGLTKNKKPDKVEEDLSAIVPKHLWTDYSTCIVWHGRRCCFARNPSCASCTVRELCPFADSV